MKVDLQSIFSSNRSNSKLDILQGIVIQVALFELFKTLEINSDVILGHSFGEIAATYAQNLSTLEQTILAAFYTTIMDEGIPLPNSKGKQKPYYRNCMISNEPIIFLLDLKFEGSPLDILPNIFKKKLDEWFLRLNGGFETEIIPARNPFHSKIPDNAVVVEIGDQFNFDVNSFKGNIKLELIDNNKEGLEALIASFGR